MHVVKVRLTKLTCQDTFLLLLIANACCSFVVLGDAEAVAVLDRGDVSGA